MGVGRLTLVFSLLLTIGSAIGIWTYFPKESSAAAYQPQFPMRAAFYYGWFPEAWDQSNIKPFTKYNPTLGWYDVGDLTTAKKHVEAMQYGNIQVGIETWWGQGHFTDENLSTLLQAASGTDFRWAVYYEQESTGDPSVSQIRNDLTYIRDKWSNDPSFLKINGKFVVFVYADGNDACGMADRWKQANTVGAYVVLKVFGGYTSCASQPDNWHQYGPAVAADSQGSHSYTISPGFDMVGQATRLGRDLSRWNQNIRNMIASGADFQLVTTFNEWGEGTAVESATEWSSSSGFGVYLDALHNDGQTQAAAPPQAPLATSTPTRTAVAATATRTPTVRAPTATARAATATRTPTRTPTPKKATATKAASTSSRSTVKTPTKTPTKTATRTPTPRKAAATATKSASTSSTSATRTPTPRNSNVRPMTVLSWWR